MSIQNVDRKTKDNIRISDDISASPRNRLNELNRMVTAAEKTVDGQNAKFRDTVIEYLEHFDRRLKKAGF